VGGENLSSRNLSSEAIIVPATNLEMRRQQDVKLQLGQKILVSFYPGVNQHSVLMGVTDHFFDDSVTPLRVRICDAEAERVGRDTLDLGSEVTSLFMDERLAVRDQKLKVTDLRPVDCRIINFVEYSGRKAIPNMA
jgi:hypothetical protein